MREIKDIKLIKEDKCYLFLWDKNYELWIPFRQGYKVYEFSTEEEFEKHMDKYKMIEGLAK